MRPHRVDRYLDGLDALVTPLEAALDAAEDAGRSDARSDLWLPAVPDVATPLPSGPPPPGSEQRREALLERLLLVTDGWSGAARTSRPGSPSLPNRTPAAPPTGTPARSATASTSSADLP